MLTESCPANCAQALGSGSSGSEKTNASEKTKAKTAIKTLGDKIKHWLSVWATRNVAFQCAALDPGRDGDAETEGRVARRRRARGLDGNWSRRHAVDGRPRGAGLRPVAQSQP